MAPVLAIATLESGRAHSPVYPPIVAQHASLLVPFRARHACLVANAEEIKVLNEAAVERSGVPEYAWQYIDSGTL